MHLPRVACDRVLRSAPAPALFRALLLAAALLALRASASTSIYLQRPPDPQAVDLARPQFDVHADGIGDDAPALQAAIDRVHAAPGHRGILFIGPGRYRLGTTVNVWRGVRLIGYGPQRPTFVLAGSTPGFQGGDPRPLFFLAGDPPSDGRPVREGGASGFFAAIVNADIEIAGTNPAAVGVTFHVAQHSFLAHMEFRLGTAHAGMNEVGNLIHHCTFVGGEYGIVATRTAPAWPFLVADCAFSGQHYAAIHTEEAGLPLVRAQIRDVPFAIEETPGQPEQLWVKDSLFERVAGPAIMASDTASPRGHLNLQNVICRETPILALLRESNDPIRGPAGNYLVTEFTHGWQGASVGGDSGIKTTAHLAPIPDAATVPASDFAQLPPVADWTNVRTLGVTGDGKADDTAALQRALQGHRVLYFPSGKYLISDTLHLRPDSILIGLHSSTTQFVASPTAPAFQGEGAPVPMVESAGGGNAILTGIGIDMETAPRVAGIKWRAGRDSVVEDVCFASSHSARGERPDADVRTAWDTQNASLWVCDGGGGTFDNIWTANTTARSGLLVSHTDTPGRVYVLSSEHHVYHEVRLDHVANWQFFALQTEAEGDEGPADLPLELRESHDIQFATTFIYRVSRTRTPYPTAIETSGCDAVAVRGLRIFSPTKYAYDNAVIEADTGRREKGREWARLLVTRNPAPERVAAAGTRTRQLAAGFESIDGLVALPSGELCFCDGRQGRIYEWTAEHGVRLRHESAVRPAMLAADPQSGALIVIARSGAAFRLVERPGTEPRLEPLPQVAVAGIPAGTRWLRPANIYGTMNFVPTATQTAEAARRADSVAVAVDRTRYGNVRMPSWANNPFWRAYTLHVATPGRDFFAIDEFRQKTYRFRVAPDGHLENPMLYADIGEADVIQDSRGRICIAAGDIFVFDQEGRPLGRIPLPDRPLSLAFRPGDDATLYVAARHALYAVELPR